MGVRLAVMLLPLCLCACVTSPRSPEIVPGEVDPLEEGNRQVFTFNDGFDRWLLEPAARGWAAITTRGIRQSTRNFFVNLDFPTRLVNDTLQGDVRQAGVETGRFAVNTTLGVLGFFDPAARWGLREREEDFGQTLAVWGLGGRPYLMLPFLGASNPRDALALLVDTALRSGPSLLSPYAVALGPVAIVNTRALALADVEQARAASLDYYEFIRDAYSQYRAAEIRNYDAPAQETQDDLYDERLDEE